MGTQIRLIAGIKGVALGTIIALAPVANAEVVGDLGTMSIGQTRFTGCDTTADSCFASGAGSTSGGSLPTSGVFTHQVLFKVDAGSAAIASAQTVNRADFDINDVSYKLYVLDTLTPGGPAGSIGDTANPLGAALATATTQDQGAARNFFLSFSTLNPLLTYYLELKGEGSGVIEESAAYTTQVSVSAVPLPPALFLLAAALAGLVGFSRIKRNRAAA